MVYSTAIAVVVLTIILQIVVVHYKYNMITIITGPIIINVIPFIMVGQYDNNQLRINGIPIAYIPILTTMLVLFLHERHNSHKYLRKISYISTTLTLYIIISSLVHINTIQATMPYVMMYVVYFMILFCVASNASRLDKNEFNEVIKNVMYVIVVATVVGIIKYISGISKDGNFMPLLNRNGTTLWVVTGGIMALYSFINRIISWKKAFIIYAILCVGIVLTMSRMGVISFVFGQIVFIMLLKGMVIKRMFQVIIVIIIVFVALSILMPSTLDRIISLKNISQVYVNDTTIYKGMPDYRRTELIRAGIYNIKNNWLFGTGPGLENYKEGLKGFIITTHVGKAHNFYISYLAELGIVGFSMFIYLLILILSLLRKIINSRQRSLFVSFWITIMFMLLMNEYITIPEVWIIWGMGIGVSMKKDV